jgi:hypothetical protein
VRDRGQWLGSFSDARERARRKSVDCLRTARHAELAEYGAQLVRDGAGGSAAESGDVVVTATLHQQAQHDLLRARQRLRQLQIRSPGAHDQGAHLVLVHGGDEALRRLSPRRVGGARGQHQQDGDAGNPAVLQAHQLQRSLHRARHGGRGQLQIDGDRLRTFAEQHAFDHAQTAIAGRPARCPFGARFDHQVAAFAGAERVHHAPAAARQLRPEQTEIETFAVGRYHSLCARTCARSLRAEEADCFARCLVAVRVVGPPVALLPVVVGHGSLALWDARVPARTGRFARCPRC